MNMSTSLKIPMIGCLSSVSFIALTYADIGWYKVRKGPKPLVRKAYILNHNGLYYSQGPIQKLFIYTCTISFALLMIWPLKFSKGPIKLKL